MLDWKGIRQKSEQATKWLVLGLPFFLPAYVLRFSLLGFPTTVLELYLAFIFLFFTIAHGKSGWQRAGTRIGIWRWPILTFSLVSFASVFWSLDLFSGLGLWRAFILEPLLVFFILPVILETQEDIALFLRNLYFTVIGISLWSLWQFVTGSGIPHPWNVSIEEGRRATGPFPFPNAVALFVVPASALAAACFIQKKSWLTGVAVFSGFLAVILAKSDGGLIALLAAVLVALLFSKWGRKWAIGMLLAGTLILATQPSIREPVIREVTIQSWPGQVRLYIWRETRDLLRDRPVLGAGFGGYPTVFAEYHQATAIEIFQYPHNILFNFWVEMGIFGVLAFGWILVTWLRGANRGNYLVIFAVLIAILVHGLVDVPYFKNDLAVMFWILIFLTTQIGIDGKKGRG